MIRTDDPQDTQWLTAMSDEPWPPRRPFVPQGCDQQGRLKPSIEPAHAASEIDDEPNRALAAIELAETLRRFVWGAAVVAAVALGAHIGVGL